MQTCCLIIPTYNNASTLLQVIESAKTYSNYIIVVNDGSTDDTHALLQGMGENGRDKGRMDEEEQIIEIVEYKINRGKGYALRCGFKRAVQAGFRYAITLDADGQHYASDIPRFIAAIAETPDALLVGSRFLEQENMPAKNSFANRFSNFWYHLQTLRYLPDTQSGFRLYPVQKMRRMHFFCNRYEAELEMLVRLSWRLIPVKAIPVSVYYAPAGERVSHFRPFLDFFRISLLNTLFTVVAVVYFYPKLLIWKLIKLNTPK
ncbi:MAG: glycosyltransferase family 2 protein [Bacteroidales bacterium]|jgi:glycosyltransferase involved in cell wall biosynthesis|nr:glycosyltransferase family 2 protein [Bacteroidales bacterium]